MAKVRRILNLVTVETAKRRRTCSHNRKNHSIQGGEVCLVIKEASGEGSKNYCVPCGLEILTLAADELATLRESLS